MPKADLPFLICGCSEFDMGQIAEILPKQSRIFVARWSGKPAIDFLPEKYGGLIILGDSEDWATGRIYASERRWLGRAIEYGRPVLGICHGAQLLAAYLNQQCDGKALSKSRTKEHYRVLTPAAVAGEGKTDPVVRHFTRGAPVIQAHKDAFQKPLRATALMESIEHTYRHCEAFRVGSPEAAVYGLQFHPEPTLQMLLSERADERWFDTIPPREELERAVQAGEMALRAWFGLATARTVGKRLETL